MNKLFKVYLSKLYLGTYLASSKYEAIERCKIRFNNYNTQTNISLWRTKLIVV